MTTGKHVTIDKVRRPIDGQDLPHLSDTLAAEGRDFDLVRVVDDDGRLSVEIWKKVSTRRGKNRRDVMAELCAPHLPGCAPSARRWSVTWGRLVFVGADGEPLVPQPAKSAWRVTAKAP